MKIRSIRGISVNVVRWMTYLTSGVVVSVARGEEGRSGLACCWAGPMYREKQGEGEGSRGLGRWRPNAGREAAASQASKREGERMSPGSFSLLEIPFLFPQNELGTILVDLNLDFKEFDMWYIWCIKEVVKKVYLMEEVNGKISRKVIRCQNKF
jgi:hypothetical protein